MKYAAVGPIAVHLPERVETNAQLKAEFPSWDMDLISQKTGIASRHIAAEGECASDLAVAAAQRLFHDHDIDPRAIDFVLLCTQTPDYPLPTTACLLQSRLDLKTSVGALDFNLGCSGYVYGLSLADGLIRSGAAKRVLLLTAETYSKYIHPADRSLRTIFGDGAAATLVEAADEPTLSAFQFGTDGTGADTLLVTKGGARPAEQAIKPRHRQRWESELYMDGPSLINFTVAAIPQLVGRHSGGRESHRQRHRSLFLSSGDAEDARPASRANGNQPRAVADRAARRGQYRQLDDSDSDQHAAQRRSPEAGHEEHARRLWRWLVVGRLHVAGDVGEVVGQTFVPAQSVSWHEWTREGVVGAGRGRESIAV